MRQKSNATPASSETLVRNIRRATRKHHAAEEKIRIVLDGLRGETSIAELCRREGWRSAAPLVLAPEKDNPALADDPQRNNNFNYAEMDPQGYAVPLGAHIRRMNPRDTTVGNIRRRRMIRRGATYGPPLPEGEPEDAIDRGIASFILCASLV